MEATACRSGIPKWLGVVKSSGEDSSPRRFDIRHGYLMSARCFWTFHAANGTPFVVYFSQKKRKKKKEKNVRRDLPEAMHINERHQ